MSLRVERFSGGAGEWDDFVRSQAGWTPFHLYAWKPLIEELFGHECLYLAARAPAGGLTGVLPLVRLRSTLFGHYLVSMPFVNYGGPVGSDEACRALSAHAVDVAQADGVRLLELRSRGPQPIELPVSHRKITVVLDLPSNVEALRKQLGSKLRSQIKRPEKEGVTVAFGADQVDPFFEVFSRHMRDLGTPTQPRALFRGIAERFGGDAWFGCAWHQGRPIAAGAGFRWGQEFEMTWASSLYAYNRIAPNMLLYWSFMEQAIQQRVTLFNFGRCTPNEGTHHFKKQWGSRDEQLWWYQRSRGGEATSTPSPDQGAYALGVRLWKRLPLKVANALGPRIVRGIP
jgi:FemAB-related protein (PEP-CTERM system-associated)